MSALRLVDLGEPAEGDYDVEAVTVAERSRHRDRAGELLKILGRRLVVHRVKCDGGV